MKRLCTSAFSRLLPSMRIWPNVSSNSTQNLSSTFTSPKSITVGIDLQTPNAVEINCGFVSGENVLHIAIVNEDPAMVKYLLDHGVNYNDRCYGNFMSPEDQKASRYDIINSEVVQNDQMTNYEG